MDTMSDDDRQRNKEAADNECKALEAIFKDGEYSTKKDSSSTSVTIALPFGDESKLFRNSLY